MILALASAGDALPGYGVSAIMLLFAYGFVSRTRFVFAALRSAIIVGFTPLAARLSAGEVVALLGSCSRGSMKSSQSAGSRRSRHR